MKQRWIKFALLIAIVAGTASCGVYDAVDSEQAHIQPKAQEPEEVPDLSVEQELEDVPEPSETQYIRISSQEAQDMMFAEDVIILDVRSQEEFDEGHIPGAVLLPNPEIRENAINVLPDFDQIILVYCRAGSRSETASRTLIELGYTRVYDFGGINQWQGEVVR